MVNQPSFAKAKSGHRNSSGLRTFVWTNDLVMFVPLLLAGVFAILIIAKSTTIPVPRDIEYADNQFLVEPSNIRRAWEHSPPQNETDGLTRRHTQFSQPLTTVVDIRDIKRNNNNIRNQKGLSVCFVTSQFSSSRDKTDYLYDARKTTPLLHASPMYHFLAYSNLADLKAPGWEVVVKDLREYKRWITQSRWAKFLAFRDAKIKDTCQVVFYIDGVLSPRDDPELFQAEARKIVESDIQFAQRMHPYGGGIEAEFDRIRLKKKDLKKNVIASLQWLWAQPDYDKNCTLYENSMFGYAIDSTAFQKAAVFFWEHYSKEEDSWRGKKVLEKKH